MTDASSSSDAGDTYFRAVLTPHRSLGPVGFSILMVAIGGISFIAGLYFYLIGAWPIMGFFGLDFALIYFGFKLNYRSARARDVITIGRDGSMVLERFDAKGKSTRQAFNAMWARVSVIEKPNAITRMELSSHGKSYPFGGFLGEEEKFAFAEELRNVLEAFRSGDAVSSHPAV